jgi:hypothetical protein
MGRSDQRYKAIRYIKAAPIVISRICRVKTSVGVFNYYVGISRGYMQIASWIRILRCQG